MIDWLDVSIHAGIALIMVALAGIAHPFLAWEVAAITAAAFWAREAVQHMNRIGIDGDPAKAINPLRWGLGSQMEFYAPALTAILIALVWSIA